MGAADQINRIGDNLYRGLSALGQNKEDMARIGLAEAKVGADLAERAIELPVKQLAAMDAKKEMDWKKAPASFWGVIPKDKKMPGTQGLEHIATSEHLLNDIQDLIGADLDLTPGSPTRSQWVKRDGSGVMSNHDMQPYDPKIKRLWYLDMGLGRTFRARDEQLEKEALMPGPKGDEARTLLAEFRKTTNDPAWKLKMYQNYRASLANDPYPDEALKRAIEYADKHIARFQKEVDRAEDQRFRRQLAQEDRDFRKQLRTEEWGRKNAHRDEDQKIRAEERAEDHAWDREKFTTKQASKIGGIYVVKNGPTFPTMADLEKWHKLNAPYKTDAAGNVLYDAKNNPLRVPLAEMMDSGVISFVSGDQSQAAPQAAPPAPQGGPGVRMPVDTSQQPQAAQQPMPGMVESSLRQAANGSWYIQDTNGQWHRYETGDGR